MERVGMPGAWQLPQGGIEDGEGPIEALWRELREETGLTSAAVELVGEVPEWLGYELPEEFRSGKTGRGQVHKWFLLRVRPSQSPLNLDPALGGEFMSWSWRSLAELAETTVPFRQPVYRHLAMIVNTLGSE